MRAAHMAIPEDAWPFPDKAGSVRAKSFLFKEISMQKKLLVFLVLLLILPVASMARDFDGFRADVPRDGRSWRKRAPWWDSYRPTGKPL